MALYLILHKFTFSTTILLWLEVLKGGFQYTSSHPVNTDAIWGWDSIGSSYLQQVKAIGFQSYLQYIPRNMHTVFALLCFVVVIHWLIFPYPSGLLHWHCGNLTIAPMPAKQPWWIWINTSFEFIMNDYITTTKQSTTQLCAYFLGYTVNIAWYFPIVKGLTVIIHPIHAMVHYVSDLCGLRSFLTWAIRCVIDQNHWPYEFHAFVQQAIHQIWVTRHCINSDGTMGACQYLKAAYRAMKIRAEK